MALRASRTPLAVRLTNPRLAIAARLLRRLRAPLLLSLFVSIGLGSSASAQLVNGGFETGDTTGWVEVIPAGGFINVVGAGSGEVAIEGSFFAHMKTNGPGSFTTLSQTFDAVRGDEINGFAFFVDQEFLEFQPCNFEDSMTVKITAPGPALVATVYFAQHCPLGPAEFGDPFDFEDGSTTGAAVPVLTSSRPSCRSTPRTSCSSTSCAKSTTRTASAPGRRSPTSTTTARTRRPTSSPPSTPNANGCGSWASPTWIAT